jgi:hypothetical protein
VVKTLVTGVALVLLATVAAADEVEDLVRATCRWIDSEETIPTSLLQRVTASDGDEADPSEGIARESEEGAPGSLCWRLTEIERLSKETIDRMLTHLDGAGRRRRGGGGESDPDPAACGQFLRCLLQSGIGAVQDQSWREEFTRICSMTDVADTLSREELQALIDDSEKLLRALEERSAPEVKVYVFRLKMCRDLFVYSLQLLDSKAPADQGS